MNATMKMKTLVLTASLAVGMGSITRVAVAAPTPLAPAAVERAAQIVRGEASGILAWVYPTATFNNVGGCDWSGAGNGFRLSCRFNYTDNDGDRAHRDLNFDLDRHGMVTTIRDGGGDSFVPPFFWLSLARGVMAQMAKDELAKSSQDADDNNRRLMKLLAESPEPQQVLAFLLDIEIGA